MPGPLEHAAGVLANNGFKGASVDATHGGVDHYGGYEEWSFVDALGEARTALVRVTRGTAGHTYHVNSWEGWCDQEEAESSGKVVT